MKQPSCLVLVRERVRFTAGIGIEMDLFGIRCIGFLPAAGGDVCDVESQISGFENLGGALALIGPASTPVTAVLVSHLWHHYSSVGVFSENSGDYVIASSRDRNYVVGDIIRRHEVTV